MNELHKIWPPPPSGEGPTRRLQGIELGIFLLLILPSMGLSITTGQSTDLPFTAVAVATIFRDTALVTLVLYFLWQNRERWQRLGWTRANLWVEIGWGVVLFPLILIGAGWLENLLREVGLSSPTEQVPDFLHAQGAGQVILATIMVIVVAISEETIFRGYLILRLANTTLSIPIAIILSTVIFSLGHSYQGTAGVITVGVVGLALAIIYVLRRSLVAPVTIHFLLDFTSIVLAPFLGPQNMW